MRIRGIHNRDIAGLDKLFRACMTDLIVREKKELNFIEEEVEQLNRTVQESITDPETAVFVAEMEERMVGTIAIIKPNAIISENINTEKNVFEIACVYVHPDFQRQGIGKILFQHIKKELIQRGQVKYYLDAGFSSSQQYWRQLLGEPSVILKDYWGEGQHHFIWSHSVYDNQEKD